MYFSTCELQFYTAVRCKCVCNIFSPPMQCILVKVPQRVHYMKYCMRVWARGKYSMRRSRVLYLASRPCPRAIFHVVHERMQYFNWFIVFLNFCAVLELMC